MHGLAFGGREAYPKSGLRGKDRALHFLDIELQTHRPGELAAFYEDALQLPVQAGRSSFTVQMGSTQLRFALSNEAEPCYHLAFNIPENRIEQACAWLEKRAQLVPHFKTGDLIINWPDWNAHSVYFFDAAGNILEVIARHDLHNAISHEFGPGDLLSVSELGLVVPDPHATLDQLARAFDLASKSVLSGFAALGDDHGLFIISAENRPWMPTDIPAKPFPARAVIQHRVSAAVEIGDIYGIESRS
jgi:hypothetical protein